MKESEMMHGTDWNGQNPTGWFVSEKLNGCRLEWDGRKPWTKSGKEISAPEWFTRGLPKNVRLSCEIYADGDLESSRRATQYGHFDKRVHGLYIFDCPNAQGDIQRRLNRADSFLTYRSHLHTIAPLTRCKSLSHLIVCLELVKANGGEGIMLHHPTAPWSAGRTTNLLKVKSLSALKSFQN